MARATRAEQQYMVGQREPIRSLFDRPVCLGDLYHGRSAFLICGGPSFDDEQAEQLPFSALVMAVNGYVDRVRPNLWTFVDRPHQFPESVWLDPTILKFSPYQLAGYAVKEPPTGVSIPSPYPMVRECPTTLFYHRTFDWNPARFFDEPSVMWGDMPDESDPGVRSVMFPALRILYHLGVRRVFLLGCDFTKGYGPDCGKAPYFDRLNTKLNELKTVFIENDFRVLNCNPQSNCTAFAKTTIEDAVESVQRELTGV